jgi:hypothetical protein
LSALKFLYKNGSHGDGFEDMLCRVPSLERVHSLVGWKPLASHDTIINDIIADMKSRTLMV